MKLIWFLLAMACCLMQGCASIYISRTDESLMNLLPSDRDISESNPALSIKCFSTYVPALNIEVDLFASQYISCFKNAVNKFNFADKKTICQRRQLEEAVTATCVHVSRCQGIAASAIDIFNCYAAEGASTTKQMYQVSANAVEYRQDLKIQYTSIEDDQNKCRNAAERGYIEDTVCLYEELQRCLKSQGPTLNSNTTTPKAYQYQYGSKTLKYQCSKWHP